METLFSLTLAYIPMRTDQSEMDAIPAEPYIITVTIDFPQPNSAALKSPAFREAVAKEDASKVFFP